MIHHREFVRRMHLMLNISGLTLYLVIQRAYPNMNPRMSFKQRKNVNNNDSMKKQLKGRNCSIHLSMHDYLPSNRLGKLILSFDQDPTSSFIAPSHQWLLDQVTTMENLEVLLGVQTDTSRVEIQVGDTTLIVEVKVEVTAVDHIQHKDVATHIPQVLCLAQGLEQAAVAMELVLLTTRRQVHMVVDQVLVEAQT